MSFSDFYFTPQYHHYHTTYSSLHVYVMCASTDHTWPPQQISVHVCMLFNVCRLHILLHGSGYLYVCVCVNSAYHTHTHMHTCTHTHTQMYYTRTRTHNTHTYTQHTHITHTHLTHTHMHIHTHTHTCTPQEVALKEKLASTGRTLKKHYSLAPVGDMTPVTVSPSPSSSESEAAHEVIVRVSLQPTHALPLHAQPQSLSRADSGIVYSRADSPELEPSVCILVCCVCIVVEEVYVYIYIP